MSAIQQTSFNLSTVVKQKLFQSVTDALAERNIKVCFLIVFNNSDVGIIVKFDVQL